MFKINILLYSLNLSYVSCDYVLVVEINIFDCKYKVF